MRLSTFKDFCAYFNKIAEDPAKLAPQTTIREFLKARQHILVCPKCERLVEAVASEAEDKGIYISEN